MDVWVDGRPGEIGGPALVLHVVYVWFLARMQRCTQSPGTSAHAVPHSQARRGLPEGPGSTNTPLSDSDHTLDPFLDLLST